MNIKSKRLELMAMVESDPDAQVVSMEKYIRYFESASDELRARVKDFARYSAAWDVLAMCLNFGGWHDGDKDLLIGVTNQFMDDCRTNVKMR
jgi:hypothetical protein